MSTAICTDQRIFNFSAGPATLPESVIKRAQADLWSIDGSGIGIMEHSHRGPVFKKVIEQAEERCRKLAGISDDHAVLFLQGGASLQFAMIPMNFLAAGRTADYADTGVWTAKAIKEAQGIGNVNVAFDGKTCDFDHCPTDAELSTTDGAAYFHYCSNNTIYGTRFQCPPNTSAPLICDASSEMFSRPWDFNRHAMVYAGAQKNLGPAGCALVIVNREFMSNATSGLPTMLDYRKHDAKGSCLNTPPTFGIYVMSEVFQWILDQGGLEAVQQLNDDKASLIYDAIDGSNGFYRPVAHADSRSVMNISFRTPNAELDKAFLKEAADHDMSGLKGHRDVGGLRASVYNAFPRQGCEVLASFMADFASRHAGG